MIKIGILGANGRMGKTLIETVLQDKDSILQAATVRPGHALEGTPLLVQGSDVTYDGNIQRAFQHCAVMIDFTLPVATSLFLKQAMTSQTPLVIGTTGLQASDHRLMKELAESVPVLYATNMSLGVTLLNALVEKASQTLGDEFDIEILEMHHRHKKDLPSGTALTLGDAAARGRGVTLQNVQCNRHTQGARQQGSIGFASLRGGSVFGDHEVKMTSNEEMITLSHRALTRDVFAKGALKAAKWITTQKPGLYSMTDVLGLL